MHRSVYSNDRSPLTYRGSLAGELTSSASDLLYVSGKQLNLSQLCLPSKNENLG